MKLRPLLSLATLMSSLLFTQYASASDDRLKTALEGGITIIQAHGFGADAAAKMKESGLTELENSGLHIFAVDKNGVILFDLSGQTEPGVDLSGIADMEGNETAQYVKDAANGKNNGFYRSQASWPHPIKGTMSPSTFYCKKVGENSVCSMIWYQQ